MSFPTQNNFETIYKLTREKLFVKVLRSQSTYPKHLKELINSMVIKGSGCSKIKDGLNNKHMTLLVGKNILKDIPYISSFKVGHILCS